MYTTPEFPFCATVFFFFWWLRILNFFLRALTGTSTSQLDPPNVQTELIMLSLPAIAGQAIEPLAQLMETAYIGRLGKFSLFPSLFFASSFSGFCTPYHKSLFFWFNCYRYCLVFCELTRGVVVVLTNLMWFLLPIICPDYNC